MKKYIIMILIFVSTNKMSQCSASAGSACSADVNSKVYRDAKAAMDDNKHKDNKQDTKSNDRAALEKHQQKQWEKDKEAGMLSAISAFSCVIQ